MMATSKKMVEQDPGEIEALLPWRAAGTLNATDARRVDEALARDPALARQYAAIQEEYSATIELNESLGGPSPRAMQKLFAAIDAEPARHAAAAAGLSGRFTGFFAGLSPRALVWAASLAGLALLLQAGLIGMMLAWPQTGTFQVASYQSRPGEAQAPRQVEPITRSLSAGPAPRAFVRFAPDARAAEITALLDRYQASVIDSAKGGIFRLQFGGQQDAATLINRLQDEKIVALVLPAP